MDKSQNTKTPFLPPLAKSYKNGNHFVFIFNDGTKIKQTINPDDTYFTYDFAENADIKITDYCDVGCPYCHEDSNCKGKHADLKSMKNIISSMHPGTELAIGGGNALAHPDLEWFLKELKEKGVLANITVNQKSLNETEVNRLVRWSNDGLIHGIGVSLVDSRNFDSALIDKLGNNVVIHIIAGIAEMRDLRVLKGRKVLILGYKDLRRGHDYANSPWMAGPGNISNKIKKNQEMLIRMLPYLEETAKSISFDCLGIKQLNPKVALNINDELYSTVFQGEDTDVSDGKGNITCSTFYINAVDKTCARMSTAALDKRFKFSDTDSIDDLFKLSTKDW